ncbi:MAG: SDR family oxidoreductase [Candidatus Acidiferrales bacterium]
MILITGATGNVGVELIKKLSALGEPVRAFVHQKTHARAIVLPEVELYEGDFSKPETFAAALEGIDRLFLLIPSSAEVEQQQRNFVDAAVRAKIKQIVKLSQFGADKQARGRFQRYHGVVENYIRRFDIPFTFLRPNLFMQGLLNFRSAIASQSALYAPAGEAKVSVIDVRDIAAVAAKTLTESGHLGKTYDLTGPESLLHSEMADHLSLALMKPIKFVDVPPNTFKNALLGFGMSPWQADGLVEDYEHYRRGEAAKVTSTVRDVTGNDPIPFSRFARDNAGKFLGKAAGV